MKPYPLRLEISGPTALWARPDTMPCLGWKEFVPDYVGPFRPKTQVCEIENHELPTMLRMVFDQTVIFFQN
jgi:hypothetical protein